jgi:hypothetical protein
VGGGYLETSTKQKARKEATLKRARDDNGTGNFV